MRTAARRGLVCVEFWRGFRGVFSWMDIGVFRAQFPLGWSLLVNIVARCEFDHTKFGVSFGRWVVGMIGAGGAASGGLDCYGDGAV